MKDLCTHLLILCTNMAFDLQFESIDNPLRSHACSENIAAETLLLVPIILQNSIFRNSRRRVDQYGWSRCAKVSRTKVDGISFVGSYFSMLSNVPPNIPPTNTRIIIHTIQRTVVVAAMARAFPYPHLGISVLSVFALLPQNGEKMTCTRENWRNGRQRNFIRFRSYANLDRSLSQKLPFLVNI